jgi:choline kinase
MNALTVVIDATIPDDEAVMSPALLEVASLPILIRTLLACQRAGFRKAVLIVQESDLDRVRMTVARARGVHIMTELVAVTEENRGLPILEAASHVNRAFLVLPGDALVSEALLEAAQHATMSGDGICALVDRGEQVWNRPVEPAGVRVHADLITAFGVARHQANALFTGAWVGTREALVLLRRVRDEGAEAPLMEMFGRLVSERRATHGAVIDDNWSRTATFDQRLDAQQQLFVGLGSDGPRGGLLGRHATALAVRLGVKPRISGAWFSLARAFAVLTGGALVFMGAERYWLAMLGALLLIAGTVAGCVARVVTRLQLPAREPLTWSTAVREDIFGLIPLVAMGSHLYQREGLHLFLILTVMLVLFVAYSRYVIYFELVRRHGGLRNHARFRWWFEGHEIVQKPVARALLAGVHQYARWDVISISASTLVLLGLLAPGFSILCAMASMAFLVSLAHQIQRGDL